MDGLEAVDLKLNEVLEDNEKFRFDSEFFKKEYLNAYRLIKSKPNKQLGDITDTLTDFSANGSYENIANNFTLLDEKNYAYMVRTTDLENQNFTQNVKYIDEHSYNFLKKSQIFGGEILINKIGSPGRTYIMPKLNIPVSLGMNLFMIKLSKNLQYTEEFIWAFLNSKLGKLIIERKINGTVPLTIDKIAIKTLYIPKLSEVFQLKITDIINLSHQKLEYSKTLYKEAEELLLKEIDLLDFKPSVENISIQSFKDSFGTSGRIDSEYYQPKYDELIEHIKKTKFDKLSNIVNIKKSIEPGSEAYQDEGIPFIRVSNVTKFDISDTEIHLSKNILKKEDLEELYPSKDTILLSKDGTVGIAYKIKNETEMITSGALLHLSVKRDDVFPEYLTLVLNSLIVQLQADRDAGGSIIKHWKPSEIQEVLIPIIDNSIQSKIEEKIKKSFELKEESKQLLELAKRAVEVAIEKNEDEAIKIISETLV
ncbi:restriction endonuclease subunit S [Aliarcobacter butzleri]